MIALNNPVTRLKLQITDTKLSIPVVTKENDQKLLEKYISGFKRTVKGNKYRSQMTTQSQINNLNFLIDPTFVNINRLFVLSFARTATGDSFSHYYVPSIEIKDFNVLIDGKGIFTC